MAFNKERRTMGFKIETTPYTRESLTSSDFDMRVMNIEYDPNVQVTARKLARGDLSLDQAVIGKRDIKIKFRAEIYPSPDSFSNPPAWGKALKACGFVETVSAGNGVSYLPSSLRTNVPATIEIPELDEGTSPSQIVVQCHGWMGTAVMGIEKVGMPMYIDFDGTAVLDGFVDRSWANRIQPLITDTEPTPPALSAAIMRNGKEQTLDTLKITLGNKVEIFTSPSPITGFLGSHVVSRDPMIELDPDLQPISYEDLWTELTTLENAAAFSAQIGTKIKIKAPKAQLVDAVKPGEREGHIIRNVKLRLCRNIGDDEIAIYTGTPSYIAGV